MIVGEPSLMGGEMDDEDERYITRLENNQFDPNGGSLIYPKQQFISNIKREQISFPGSPQQQLPSMFSNNPPTSNGVNTTSNVLPPSSASMNGELSTAAKRISTSNNNSLNSPQTPSANNYNQVCFNIFIVSSRDSSEV